MHEGEEMESALGAEKERREGKKEWRWLRVVEVGYGDTGVSSKQNLSSLTFLCVYEVL